MTEQRGAPISLPQSFIDEVRQKAERLGLAEYRALGKKAGVGKTSVMRFYANSASTVIARKIALAVGVELPVVGLGVSPKLDEWVGYGRDLLEVDPEKFSELLDAVKDYVERARAWQKTRGVLLSR